MITLAVAATFYRAAAGQCESELIGLVETVTHHAAHLARGYIGHEQRDWPELSSATVEGFRHEAGFWITGKRELGYGGYDNPLERTGELRDSIDTDVGTLVGVVGSDSKTALYMELGTPGARYPAPPRPIFSKAMAEAADEPAVELLAHAVAVKLLVPKL
jgi:hypothetical protein